MVLHVTPADMFMMPEYFKPVPKFAIMTSYRNTLTASTKLYGICTRRCSENILEISTPRLPKYTTEQLSLKNHCNKLALIHALNGRAEVTLCVM